MISTTSQAREFISRSVVMPMFVRDGFTPYLPEWDEGVDFILYRERDDLLVKVQLKSRWTIEQKYVGRKIGVLFHENKASDDSSNQRDWYLCPHDKMVEYARTNTRFLDSLSWTKAVEKKGEVKRIGGYSVRRMNRAMRAFFVGYRLSPHASNEPIYEKFRAAS